MLLAGISAMAWWYASRREAEEERVAPETDPLGSWQATPSQKATVKYFWVVSALILVQMLLGVITAHYGVEGDGVLRISALEVVAVQRGSNVAHSIGPVLDRHGLVGSRIVHRPVGERAGTEGTTPGRQRVVPGFAARRGRFTDRRMAEHSQQDDRYGVVLLRPSGLRVCGPGTSVADCPVRRPAALAVLDDSSSAGPLCEKKGSRSSLWPCWPSPRVPSPCSTVRD